MKFSISRETLLKALKHTQSVVEKRTSIAILSNVRLKAENNKLELTATDNDITVQGIAEAFVDGAGVTTANAHKLFEIVSKIPEGVMVEMTLNGEGNRLSITAGKAKFSLACLAADAFPDMTKVDGGTVFTLSSNELKRLLAKSQFASATDETRAYLNGIYLHVAEADGAKVLRAAATDGHRLARVDASVPEGLTELQGVILPRKTVAELRRLTEDAKEVTFRVTDRLIQAETSEITVTSKVVDGNFPDYDKVIPADNNLTMDVPARALLQAVDRVAILSHEKSRSIKFSLQSGNLLITANNPDQENAAEELKVDYDKDSMDVGFNARYVADIGNQMDGDDMQFWFKDPASPVIVRDPKDAGALFVVMPMRV
jgi:DNA polymerase-3 subunit beta